MAVAQVEVLALVVAVAQDAVVAQVVDVERVAAALLRTTATLLLAVVALLQTEAALLRVATQSAAEARTAADSNWGGLDVYDDSRSSQGNDTQECRNSICSNPDIRIPVLAPYPLVEIRGYLEALDLAEAPSA